MGRVHIALNKAGKLPADEPTIGRPEPRVRAEQSLASEQALPFAPLDQTGEAISAMNRRSLAPDRQTTSASSSAGRIAVRQAVLPNQLGNAQPPQTVDSTLQNEIVSLSEMIRATPRSPVVSPTQPVFGEPSAVRLIALKVAPHLAIHPQANAAVIASVHTLARCVRETAAARKLKTLLITSAGDGEGKTSVAINLAWALAGECRVLLVEAQAINPGVKGLLGLQTPAGWPDVASGALKFEQAALHIAPLRLYWLAAQTTRPRAATPSAHVVGQAAISEPPAVLQLQGVLNRLTPQFDFIIVDAAPLAAVDTQRLAAAMDATLLVIRADQTSRRSVKEALNLLPGQKCLGTVLNEAQVDCVRTRR